MSWPSRSRYRRPRGTGIGGLLVQIAKDQAKHNAGELHTIPNGYKFSDAGYTNPSGVFIKPRPTADGHLASLVCGLKMVTNCPKPPGDFPSFERDGEVKIYVPLKDCRKCEFHLKRKRGQPYPCCAMLREQRKHGPSPIAKAFGMLAEAKEAAKEIMGQ